VSEAQLMLVPRQYPFASHRSVWVQAFLSSQAEPAAL
jgi:hypothetical protein